MSLDKAMLQRLLANEALDQQCDLKGRCLCYWPMLVVFRTLYLKTVLSSCMQSTTC